MGGLRGGLLIEAATGAVVLAITAVLAGVPKARGAQPASIERTASGPGLSLRVLADTPVVDRPGGIHLTVTRTEGGRPGRIDVTGSLTLPSRDLGPIKVPFVADGVDHATATNVRFPARGRWRLSVLVRTGPLDATQFTVTIPVR
ncbi:MAG: hypothetical protein IRY90_02980 [Actinomadura rubrobrunea]|nr:hypothetical protein [Actinomadura rubrobrunea]